MVFDIGVYHGRFGDITPWKTICLPQTINAFFESNEAFVEVKIQVLMRVKSFMLSCSLVRIM